MKTTTSHVKNVSKDLSAHAKLVWSESDINEKRKRLHEMLVDFRFPKKIPIFEKKINDPNITGNKLDKLAADLMLCDTDKVIKI